MCVCVCVCVCVNLIVCGSKVDCNTGGEPVDHWDRPALFSECPEFLRDVHRAPVGHQHLQKCHNPHINCTHTWRSALYLVAKTQ